MASIPDLMRLTVIKEHDFSDLLNTTVLSALCRMTMQYWYNLSTIFVGAAVSQKDGETP
jgi:hypothetical protein